MTTDTMPQTVTPDDLTQVVKTSIAAAQTKRDLNDTELAASYGIHRMTIWRWKKGQLTHTDRALIDLLRAYFDSSPQTDT